MAFIKSKKVYAILMNDNDGRKIVEQANDLTQPELDKKIDEFFNSHSGATENPEIANTRQEEGGEDYTLEIEKENIGKDKEGEKATNDYVKELFEKGLTKDEIIDILREDKEYADLPVPKAVRNSLDNLGMAEWTYDIPEMVETIEEQFGSPKEEVDYLSEAYLEKIYNENNKDENAMIDHLRQFDTGVSNGDMQGIVEAFVMKKKNEENIGKDEEIIYTKTYRGNESKEIPIRSSDYNSVMLNYDETRNRTEIRFLGGSRYAPKSDITVKGKITSKEQLLKEIKKHDKGK